MNRENNSTETIVGTVGQKSKRPYQTPALVAYGRVEDMTRGGSKSTKEAGGTKAKK